MAKNDAIGLTDDQADRLRKAFALALSVYEEMAQPEICCGGCGAKSFPNRDKWHARKMLGGAVARLEKVEKYGVKGDGTRFVPDDPIQ